jgi:hypothetical protein
MAVIALLPAVTLVSEPFDFRIGVVLGVALVLAIWGALFFLAPVIKVSKTNLTVGRASIPRALIGRIDEIAKDEIFQDPVAKIS